MKVGASIFMMLIGLLSFTQSSKFNLSNLNELNSRNAKLQESYSQYFKHGLASGDPLQNAVIIWTRVSDVANNYLDVDYQVSKDIDFIDIVDSGTFTTDASIDFTVKIDLQGLEPSTTYYYQFEYNGEFSIIGRTKTANLSEDHLRFGVVSCSNYQSGYFNAYRILANQADLDAILHLGDYFYEYAEGSFGYDSLLMRGHDPDHEILSLMDYRTRYSFYRSDADLQFVHQQHPFISIWDDHEFANDAYKDGAENHQTNEGDWEVRKANSKQAFFEWMPVRNNNNNEIYRSIDYGDLMKLTMIDTRIKGREMQLEPTDSLLHADDRTLLGTEQLDWLKNEMLNNNSEWHIIGNQVIFSTTNMGTLVTLDPAAPTLFMDTWQGYPKERDGLINFVADNNLDNIVICTGDFHTGLAFDIALNPYDSASYNPVTGEGSKMVEIAVPSVTSPNFDEYIGTLVAAIEGLFPLFNPQNKYANYRDHGYCILDVKTDSATVDYFFSENIKEITNNQTYGGSVSSKNGFNTWNFDTIPTEAKSVSPDLAPVSIKEVEPNEINILNVYPNPASNYNYINFNNVAGKILYLDIYTTDGKFVERVVNQQLSPGYYSLKVDLDNLSAGNYFYNFTVDNKKAAPYFLQ